MRSGNLSLHEEGKTGHCKVFCVGRWVQAMKKLWMQEGFGLTCSAEYFGDDVGVIKRKKERDTNEMQKKEEQPNDGSNGGLQIFDRC